MNGGLHSDSRTLSNMHTSDVEHRTHPLHVDLHPTQPIKHGSIIELLVLWGGKAAL